jgi:hypothetical protein
MKNTFLAAVVFCFSPAFAQEHYFKTLDKTHFAGFQGWFSCPSDKTGAGWAHWYRGGSNINNPSSLAVDNWPDTSELDADEKCPTPHKDALGNPIYLYSNANPKTIERQIRWAAQYGIDGLAVQRFASDLDPIRYPFYRQVLQNVQASAENNRRGFFVMYDGIAPTTIDLIKSDWKKIKSEGITNSPAYTFHRGKPVVGLWGLGFKERSTTSAQAADLIEFFRAEGATVLGGVPSRWRTLTADSHPEKEWANIYRSFDVISPWSVGRFISESAADAYTTAVTEPDLIETKRLHIDYMPTVFPGFSWHNGRASTAASSVNAFPRKCGSFYKHQLDAAINAGATMIYTAMFDEIQEGTAIFKLAVDQKSVPKGLDVVPLNADGCTNAVSDMYLRIAGQASKMLKERK